MAPVLISTPLVLPQLRVDPVLILPPLLIMGLSPRHAGEVSDLAGRLP